MFESRPWDDSDLQLFQLQEKFNAYVSFLLDGEMAEAHPELAGKNATDRAALCGDAGRSCARSAQRDPRSARAAGDSRGGDRGRPPRELRQAVAPAEGRALSKISGTSSPVSDRAFRAHARNSSSIKNCASSSSPPTFLINAAAAADVPPVASRSSISTIFSPGSMLSTCISISASPYSSE